MIEQTSSPARSSYVPRSLVGRAEVVVYVMVATLLLVAAAVTCCFAVVRAVQQFWSGKPLEGVFSFVNDLFHQKIVSSA